MKTTLCLPAPATITIPCYYDAAEIRKICGVDRIREFNVIPTSEGSRFRVRKTWPYKGKFKTYPKMVNDAYITSYATLSAGMITVHQAARPVVTRTAPSGMAFQRDTNGVKVVRLSDGMDYHPTNADIRAKDFATRVRKAMAENFKRRQEQKRAEKNAAKNKAEAARQETLFRRDLSTTRVTLLDSRLAGNCIEGALVFAERKLKIDRKDILGGGHLFSVSAATLLSVANGDTERATAAAKMAWRRETMLSI